MLFGVGISDVRSELCVWNLMASAQNKKQTKENEVLRAENAEYSALQNKLVRI